VTIFAESNAHEVLDEIVPEIAYESERSDETILKPVSRVDVTMNKPTQDSAKFIPNDSGYVHDRLKYGKNIVKDSLFVPINTNFRQLSHRPALQPTLPLAEDPSIARRGARNQKLQEKIQKVSGQTILPYLN